MKLETIFSLAKRHNVITVSLLIEECNYTPEIAKQILESYVANKKLTE